MAMVDYAFIGLVALSTLLSLFRGFAREALSLASFIVAVWVALNYADALMPYLAAYIESDNLRFAASIALLFFIVILINGILIALIAQLIKKTGLSGTDRLLGMVFGAARGVVIAGLVVFLVNSTPWSESTWWRESVLKVEFEPIATWLKELLPVAGQRLGMFQTQTSA